MSAIQGLRRRRSPGSRMKETSHDVCRPFCSLPRLASLALAGWMITAATAFAQQAPAAAPKGYLDPEDIPVRPPVVDIEPVWARPAIDTVATIRMRGVLQVGVVATSRT